MTRLLVSVRDAAEARIALAAGVHLIDVKEPSRGSLGAADRERIAEVLAEVAGRVPVSAALGELFQAPQPAASIPTSLSYAKWGLAGAADHPDWVETWARAVECLSPQTKPVAVHYADRFKARSPDPGMLLSACREHGVAVLLVDTFDKSAGTLLDVCSLHELHRLVAAARDRGMMIVLGGSLSIEMLPCVLPLKPDYIAVRGAACRAGRTGAIDPARVRHLLAALEASSDSCQDSPDSAG
jgi:uncharacterized protein (UPF0264 family)